MGPASVGIGLGIATFIVAMVLACKERKEGDPDWKWALALAVIGLGSSADSVWQGISADKASTASEAREKELLGRAENAEKQLAVLVEKVTTRSELFTPDKQAQLAAAVKGAIPAKAIYLTIGQDTGEGHDFGLLLLEVLRPSGTLGEGREFSWIPPRYGVTVLHKGGPVGPALYKAIVDAGVPNVSIETVADFPDKPIDSADTIQAVLQIGKAHQ